MQYWHQGSFGRTTGPFGRRARWLPGLSALALGLAWATPASAQNSAPDQGKPQDSAPGDAKAADDNGGLSQIVVTAQFRELDLQNTPMSITAVNSDQIQQRSITNVVDVA